MPANRCSMCGVSWPTSHKECPLCGESTNYFSDVEPTKDWEEQIEEKERKQGATATRTNKVTDMRFERLRKAGLDIHRAMVLAERSHAECDIHGFEDLIEQGCGIDLAYDIIS